MDTTIKLEPKSWSLQEKYDSLSRIHDAANNAILDLERRLREAQDRIKFLEAQLENAQLNVLQQKEIVKNSLMQTATEKKELEQEIIELRKRLKNGNIN